MSNAARITSIEALEAFRANLIVFVTKSRVYLDEVAGEIGRTRTWLQTECRRHWESEIRRRRRLLDLAEQDLLTARMSNLRDDLTAQQLAVRRAKHAVQEAEDKLALVKRWSREFDQLVDPHAKKLAGLRSVLDLELPKAIAYLVETEKILDAYAERGGVATVPAAALSEPVTESETKDDSAT